MNNSKKVIIIEKDANMLFGLKARLAELKFHVSTSSGNEKIEILLQKISEEKPAFIIMGSDFYAFKTTDLIHKIKEESVLNKTKIFLILDKGDKRKEAKLYNAGVDYVIVNKGNFLDTFGKSFSKIVTNLKKLKK